MGRADDFHPCQAILLVGNVLVEGFQLVDDLRAGGVGLKAVQVVADESWIEAERLDLSEEFQVSRSLLVVHEEDQQFLPEYVFRRDIGLAEEDRIRPRSIAQFVGIEPQLVRALLHDLIQRARYLDDGVADEFLVLVCVFMPEDGVTVLERDFQVLFEKIEQRVLLLAERQRGAQGEAVVAQVFVEPRQEVQERVFAIGELDRKSVV